MSLHGVKTILAITGGIAAFKALEVLRLLKHQGADVYVVMTEHATHFLTPASCEMVSGHPVSVDFFAPLKTWEMEHIALAHGAELVLVVPATANFLAKLALGIADDLLSTLCVVLAARASMFLAPAMNTHMYTQYCRATASRYAPPAPCGNHRPTVRTAGQYTRRPGGRTAGRTRRDCHPRASTLSCHRAPATAAQTGDATTVGLLFDVISSLRSSSTSTPEIIVMVSQGHSLAQMVQPVHTSQSTMTT